MMITIAFQTTTSMGHIWGPMVRQYLQPCAHLDGRLAEAWPTVRDLTLGSLGDPRGKQ